MAKSGFDLRRSPKENQHQHRTSTRPGSRPLTPLWPACVYSRCNRPQSKGALVNRHIGLRLSALSLSLAAAFAAVAAEPVANSLTIYSSAQAGAIPADMYRYGGQRGYAVPGYAVVRHEREIELKAGRNDLRFTDVAGPDRPDHSVVPVAHRSEWNARGRAELPVRPGQHRQAAGEVHRPRHRSGADTRRQRGDVLRDAAVQLRADWSCARRMAPCEWCRTTPASSCRACPAG